MNKLNLSIFKDVHYKSKNLAEESRYTVRLIHERVALICSVWKTLTEAMASIKLDKNMIVFFRLQLLMKVVC